MTPREDVTAHERARVRTALAVVPLALTPLGLVCWVLALMLPSNAFVGLTPWLVLSPLVAYPVAWIVGYPLWLALRRWAAPSLILCAAGGALASLVGGVVVVGVIAPPHLTVLDVVFGRTGVLLEAVAFPLLGLAYGVFFWALVYRRPHAKYRIDSGIETERSASRR